MAWLTLSQQVDARAASLMMNRNDMAKVSTCRDELLYDCKALVALPVGVLAGKGGSTPPTPEGQKQGDPRPTALDAPAPSANHEDQWIGLGRRTWLEHHPDFAAVVALDDKKIGLAFIEDRPRRGAVERHQDSLRVAVPQRDLANRLSAAIDHRDTRPERHAHRLHGGAARDDAALKGRHHGRGARSGAGESRLGVFDHHAVNRDRGPQRSLQRQKLSRLVVTDPQLAVGLRSSRVRSLTTSSASSRTGLPAEKATTRPLTSST